MITFLAAYGLVKIYEKLPLHIQQQIRQVFNLHHGTIGCLLIILGIIAKNVHLISSGGAFVIHDRKDAPLWKNDIERIIAILKSKLEQFKAQQRYQIQTRYYFPNRF